MKKHVKDIFRLILLLNIFTAFTGCAILRGSKTFPKIIKNKDQLISLADSVNSAKAPSKGAYYRLGSDIDLEGMEWAPIGINREHPFLGNFDGNGHTISNFKITSMSNNGGIFNYVGLFGYSDGAIKNLGVEEFTVNVEKSLEDDKLLYLGSLAGHNGGMITDCYSTDDVNVNATASGPIIVGGLVGENHGAMIDCYAKGNMNVITLAIDSYIGGLTGWNWGEEYAVQEDNFGDIIKCYTTGKVTVNSSSRASIGCLLGYSNKGYIKESYATGQADIEASLQTAKVGGLIGYSYCDRRYNCFSKGIVNVNSTADTIVGGLIGYDEFNGIIENCYSKANITVDAAGAYVGGLFGLSSTGLIESCFSKGNVRATTSSNSVYAGGLAGEGLEITIKNCFATGNVDAVSFSAYAFAGGMAGCIGNENNTLSYCYSTGQVSATTVSFNAHAGGLIGYVSKGNRMVSYNFTIGSVSAISSSALTYAGRIMGYPADMTNNFSFKNNYYCHDQQINRQEGSATFDNSSNQVGYSCTLEQLNTSTFYFTNLGWNSDIWDFGSLNFENGKYPLLKN